MAFIPWEALFEWLPGGVWRFAIADKARVWCLQCRAGLRQANLLHWQWLRFWGI